MAGVSDEFLSQLEQKFPALSQFPGLLRHVGVSENLGNPTAVSSKQAVGEFQNMPATAADPGFGVAPYNPHNPEEGATGAAGLLNAYIMRLGNVRDGIVAYKWGIGNVLRHGADKAPKATLAQANSIVEKLSAGATKQAIPEPMGDNVPEPMGSNVPEPMGGPDRRGVPEPMGNLPIRPEEPVTPIVDQPPASVRGLKAYEETPAGGVTGFAMPRRAGTYETQINPTTARMGLEVAGASTGGLAGATFGSVMGGGPTSPAGGVTGQVGLRIGEGLGAGLASYIASKTFDPVENPVGQAVQTGALITATGGLASGGMHVLRKLVGDPSRASRVLLSEMEALGRIPTAGEALPNGLARLMQSVGTADAVMGFKVKEAVKATGTALSGVLNSTITQYLRYKGAADTAFKYVDDMVAQHLGNRFVMSVPTSVLAPIVLAAKEKASKGLPLDPVLQRIVDRAGLSVPFASGSLSFEEASAVETLLFNQARALSKAERTGTTAVLGSNNAADMYKLAGTVRDAMDNALERLTKNGALPVETRAMAIKGQALWKTYKTGELLNKTFGAELGVEQFTLKPITSNTIINGLKEIDQMAIDTRHQFIDAGIRQRVGHIAQALKASEAAQGAGEMTMAVRNVQLFSLGSFTFAGVAAEAVGRPEAEKGIMGGSILFALSPTALGYIVRNPHATETLIKGMRTGPELGAGIRATRELLTLLAQEGLISWTHPEKGGK